MRWLVRLLILVVMIMTLPSAVAISSPLPLSLSAEETRLLKRIEDYLNYIRSLRSRFVQVTDQGHYSEGRLYFVRPNRMRFEYLPPVPILIVGQSGWVVYYDKKLDQVSHIPADETPLSFLMRERISLREKVHVTGIRHGKGTVRIRLVDAEESEAGYVVLTFGLKPLMLRKWSITDATGATVHIALVDSETNISINPDLFSLEFLTQRGDSDR